VRGCLGIKGFTLRSPEAGTYYEPGGPKVQNSAEIVEGTRGGEGSYKKGKGKRKTGTELKIRLSTGQKSEKQMIYRDEKTPSTVSRNSRSQTNINPDRGPYRFEEEGG